jgi:hypothetical protein
VELLEDIHEGDALVQLEVVDPCTPQEQRAQHGLSFCGARWARPKLPAAASGSALLASRTAALTVKCRFEGLVQQPIGAGLDVARQRLARALVGRVLRYLSGRHERRLWAARIS